MDRGRDVVVVVVPRYDSDDGGSFFYCHPSFSPAPRPQSGRARDDTPQDDRRLRHGRAPATSDTRHRGQTIVDVGGGWEIDSRVVVVIIVNIVDHDDVVSLGRKM